MYYEEEKNFTVGYLSSYNAEIRFFSLFEKVDFII